MTDLRQIVTSFSNEEHHEFIAFLTKKNKRLDVKNIQLFKLLRDDALSSKDICMHLYGKSQTQAYYALRKRLFQSIIRFSANASLEDESSVQMEIITYILASRSHLQRKQYAVAFNILKKAETIALEHHLFALLNEIYTTQIQYAYTYPNSALDTLIHKLEANKKKQLLEEQLNTVYAKMRYELARNQTSNFQTIFTKTIATYGNNIINQLSFKALYQLTSIASISAFATKGYLQIEPFLINTYTTILANNSKDSQPFFHIQMLYYIANTLFRNKKFKASHTFLETMHVYMLKHKKKYYNTFQLKYNLLLALNYNYTNQQPKAILTLQPLTLSKHRDTETALDIQLCLMMFFFQNNAFKKAHHILSQFRHSDRWYKDKAGIEWVIKKNLIEILLYMELQDVDLVASRLLRFKRQYYTYLKSIYQERVIVFIELIKICFDTPEIINSNAFKQRVSTSFNFVEAQQEDIFVMSFYAWLKAKMHTTPLYTTTLEMLQNASTA